MQTLRLFCDAVRHRSISRAAAEHGITQSAASQRISALEKRLGVMLLDRSVRPLTTTPPGEVYYREVLELLERHRQLELRVARFDSELTGRIRVDAIYSAGIGLLNRVKDQFEQRYPLVAVGIDYKRPEEVYDAVREQACDLGIVSYPQRWREVGVIPLREEKMVVVCDPGHPLGQRSQVHAQELGAWRMVSFEPQLPVARRIRRYLRDHAAEPRIASVFDNIDTIKHALSVTDCFAILPKRTVLHELAKGVLHASDLEPKLTRPLGIIYPRRNGHGHRFGRPFGPAVQLFIDFLLEHAGPNVDLTDVDPAPPGALVGEQA
jgi:DNA-binding transcriptional LysR family regulator